MKKTFLLIIVYCLLTTAMPVFAQTATDYKLLAPIPLKGVGAGETTQTKAGPYIEGIFMLAIAIAGGLAVIKIIFGGIKYISTEAFTGKSDAKETIQNAIWGLLLVISAWIILYTINPKLVKFDLKIPAAESAVKTTSTGTSSSVTSGVPGTCSNCSVLEVPHKSAPYGCAAPGPCTIEKTLNDKLVALNALDKLVVTESFPPTRTHTDPCHNNGTCVDATKNCTTNQCIQKTIADAKTVGLRAEFEVTTEARAQAIREATGLSSSQVRVRPEINGEHYSIYLN